jgi:uncharacterized membrane protein
MHVSPFHYLPLTPGFFSIFICALIVLFIGLVVLDLLRHAYLNLGVSPRTAMYLLIGSLIGSYFNIPIADLPGEPVLARLSRARHRHRGAGIFPGGDNGGRRAAAVA